MVVKVFIIDSLSIRDKEKSFATLIVGFDSDYNKAIEMYPGPEL